MKKVGVITYHRYYNYGTVLQAYALQKAIEGIEGYQAELIDFCIHEEKKLSVWKLVLLRLRRLPAYLVEWKRVWTLHKYGEVLLQKNPSFDRFFKNDFVLSPKTYHSFRELRQEASIYDVMVTGSDQTWSPKIGFHPAMFLEFGNANALRIAYAPSIGVSALSKKEASFLNAHLQPYESISCRERLGTDVLSSIVKGKTISNVLDPSFLLTADEWNKIAVAPCIEGDYILCYFIGHRTYYRKIAQQLSRDMKLPLHFIPVSWLDLGKNNNLVPNVGPKEFLGLIRGARLILTDSFHGTAFSINYRKSFYSFTKIEGGRSASDNSRLYDILSRLHLEDRLFDIETEVHFSDVDYSEADKILKAEREKSLIFLKNALTDSRICPHVECTGCMACESVCAHNAIKIDKDLQGFNYPQKDLEKCVDCELCKNVCPNNSLPKYHLPKECFVATASDIGERLSSTSGGIASVLSRFVIKHGGVVYGCTSENANHVHHIRVDKEEDIIRLKGSKYVQSDMTGIMASLKNDLKKGTMVLFIGTPCQVAGVISSLPKAYDNLFTLDFVCHGVPSQQVLIDIVGNECQKLKENTLKVDFRFRDDNNHSNYGIKLSNSDGSIVYKETYPKKSRYTAGFLGGMYYRESCYQCHYACEKRVSDITVGDYWDRENIYTIVGKDSLSMVILNTERGISLFDSIKNMVNMSPVDYETLQGRSGQLKSPMPRHIDYAAFKNAYMNNGYNEEAKSLLDKEIKRLKRHHIITTAAHHIKQNALGRKTIQLTKKSCHFIKRVAQKIRE